MVWAEAEPARIAAVARAESFVIASKGEEKGGRRGGSTFFGYVFGLYTSLRPLSRPQAAPDRVLPDVVGGPEPGFMHRHKLQYRHEPGGGVVLPRFSRVTAGTEYLIRGDEQERRHVKDRKSGLDDESKLGGALI